MPTYLLVLIHIGPAAWGVYHALLYKRDPRAAMGWIMACIFVPYGGPVAYFLFGINRVRSRARGMQRRFLHVGYEAGRRKVKPASAGEPGMRDAGWRITGRTLSHGNRVTPLFNGDSAYPRMLEAINSAQHRILFATYILRPDTTGTAFAAALQAASERGVDVSVLVDGIGELYSRPRSSSLLRKRNIDVARFLPPTLFPPSVYVNLRNHRKVMVVDDRLAFAGGMNIDDAHVGTDDRPLEITDVHFELRGPVVPELSRVFGNDWHFATGRNIEDTVPTPCDQQDDMHCRIVPDGPDDELDSLAATIQTVISSAGRTVDIMTPYFLPGRELMSSLEAAALRGVRVRIVLPEENNLFYVHWAHRNMLAEMLCWDVEAYYQPAPFCHSKLLCIDRDYSLIGSANLDSRSLRLNFELGIEVFSRTLNEDLVRHIDRVIASSKRTRYEDFADRRLAVRLRDSTAALFSPYL